MRAALHRGDILKAGRIGERVEIDHVMAARHREAHDRRADETRTACDENLHTVPSHVKGLSKSLSGVAFASLSLSCGVPSKPQSIPQESQRMAPSDSGA